MPTLIDPDTAVNTKKTSTSKFPHWIVSLFSGTVALLVGGLVVWGGLPDRVKVLETKFEQKTASDIVAEKALIKELGEINGTLRVIEERLRVIEKK